MNTIISCLGFASKNNPRESSEKQRGSIDESMLTVLATVEAGGESVILLY